MSVWFLNDGRGDQGRGYGQKIFDKTIMYHDFYLCVTERGELLFFTYETDKGGSIIDKSRDYRDGKWHHAVVVKRGAAGRLFVDGEPKGGCDSIVNATVDGPLLLGYSKSPDHYQQKHWSGSIDEFVVFKRAMEEGEIRVLFDHSLAELGVKLPARAHDPPDVF